MNEIIYNNINMPVLSGCDLCAAAETFYHADRTVDFHILIYVIEGEIYVTEDETDYVVGEGELLFLKSGIHHYGKFEISRGTRWYFIHFYFDERTDIPMFRADSSPIRQYEPVCFFAPLPKKLSGLFGSKTERRIKEFIDYFHSSDEMKRWCINEHLSRLLSDICFYGEQPPLTLSERIGAYLGEHYKEPFSAKNLEKHFFLSYKYMASVFKREKGVTMQQYHNEIRMTAAQGFLKSTLLSVGEISAELGFADMLYFSRCFRIFTGMSPTEYRKKVSLKY